LITSLKHDLVQKSAEVRTIYVQRDERVKAIADLECTVRDLEDDRAESSQTRDRLTHDLAAVEQEISDKEAELRNILPRLSIVKEKEAKLKQRLDEAQGEESRLRSKQGRQVQFQSKADRDKAINQEISQVQQLMKRKELLLKDMTTKSGDLESQIKNVDSEIAELRRKLDGRKTAIEELTAECREAEEEKAKLDDERRELWRLEAKTSAEEESAKEELRKAEHQLHNTMDRNVQTGLAAAARVAKDLGLTGYYGPLYELFTLTDGRYRTAAEVTAGASLFHAVVDTDETARKILEVLIKEKAGRITFIPLNSVRVKPVKYPVGEDGQPLNETVPILERIEPVDPKFMKALESVYSRTIVCTRLETAAELAREYQLDGVTLNGSRSDRKGALSGGYHDTSRSRLQAAERMRRWRTTYEEKAAEARKTKARVEEIHQEVTRLVGVLKNARGKRTQIDEGFVPLQKDLQAKYREESALRDLLSQRVCFTSRRWLTLATIIRVAASGYEEPQRPTLISTGGTQI
jgi:structural maintenance of chromosome 3 (chondroitin sulfate proteoglycan 6)